MKLIFYLLPLLAGVAMSVQSGINSQLRNNLQHFFLAAFISFITGTLALGILLIFSKQPFPPLSVYPTISWYKFSGGLLGAFIVTGTLLSIKEIGAANMFVLVVAGQLVTAVLMDHFGVLGMNPSPITVTKVAGICLVIAGAYLVNRK